MSFPERQISLSPYSLAAALAIERELKVSHAVSQVLVRRGYDSVQSAERFLATNTEHSVESFNGIQQLVEKIKDHKTKGSKVTVHGDYDVDGVAATALLVRALSRYGLSVDTFIPSRVEDGYGLSRETVDRLAKRGTQLLITVDCGITSIDEVKHAKSLGIDTIVTDHHLPRSSGELPDAAILHPEISGYPFKGLCGCAVAYKLAKAVQQLEAVDLKVDQDLDLVALATVADAVPMVDENRRLVKQGLQRLAVTDKPGLNALLNSAQVDRESIGTDTVSFKLAPKINAAGRMYHADAALELLLTTSEQRAEEIADELQRINFERRDVERKILSEAKQQLAGQPEDRYINVVVGEGWNPGVVGIVASRLVDSTGKPSVVISAEETVGKGSCRTLPGIDIFKALDSCSEHLDRYGGHSAAAGLELELTNLEQFTQALNFAVNSQLESGTAKPKTTVDAVVSGAELTLDSAEELASLGPFGNGNPDPVLYIPGSRIEAAEAIGEGKHVRFNVASGAARSQAIAFNTDGKLPQGLEEGQEVSTLWNLSINRWQGRSSTQLRLQAVDRSVKAGVNVLDGQSKYLEQLYFELDREIAADTRLQESEASQSKPSWQLRDLRGLSAVSSVVDLSVSCDSLLAVCSNTEHWQDRLDRYVDQLDICSYEYLEFMPEVLNSYKQIVLLDPPTLPFYSDLVKTASCEYLTLTWGVSEVQQARSTVAESSELNQQLKGLYRELRSAGSVTGEVSLEATLQGSNGSKRSPYRSGRLLKVMAELELLDLNREKHELSIKSNSVKKDLESSTAYVAYRQMYSSGKQYLDKLVTK